MINRLTKCQHLSCLLIMALGIASCLDNKMPVSSEAFSSAADIHGNQRIIDETAEIDKQLKSSNGDILGGQIQLFETETQLLARKAVHDSRIINELDGAQQRNAYYGDLHVHVHTAYSFDGYAFGTLATPYDAYRFAKGEAIKNPAGFNM